MTEKTPQLRGVRPDWIVDPRRRCAPTNPDWKLWTADDKGQLNQAAKLCRRCPVLADCRTWAVNHAETWGAWGGLVVSKVDDLVQAAPSNPTETAKERRARIRDQIRDLWSQGLNDGVIALRLGIHPTAVVKIRKQAELETKFGPGGCRKKTGVSA